MSERDFRWTPRHVVSLLLGLVAISVIVIAALSTIIAFALVGMGAVRP